MNGAQLQSTLDAASGSSAELLARLGMVLYVGAGAIFITVICLALYATFSAARPVRAGHWIVGGGVIFPAVTLSALLVYSLAITTSIAALDTKTERRSLLANFGTAPGAAAALMPRVHVVGKQWWWEVRYEAPGGGGQVVLANELHVPVGQAVEVLLSSTDVIHSFWAPSLVGKVDMIPGRTTRLVIRTDDAGVYRGQCAEYCGGQHALMAFHIVAEPQAQFDAWLARQAQPATVPNDPFLRQGYDAFFRGECHECHAVRGTIATARLGPDLTHVGSRLALAAGVLDNHVGSMAGWIAGSQDVKAGNLMPSMNIYSGQDLRAIAAWLGSLQ